MGNWHKESENMTSERRNKLAHDLSAWAIKHGRWEAPRGWWDRMRGELAGMVVQDLELLDNAAKAGDVSERAERLYQRCIEGADEADHASWRQYVEDLVVAVEREHA